MSMDSSPAGGLTAGALLAGFSQGIGFASASFSTEGRAVTDAPLAGGGNSSAGGGSGGVGTTVLLRRAIAITPTASPSTMSATGHQSCTSVGTEDALTR